MRSYLVILIYNCTCYFNGFAHQQSAGHCTTEYLDIWSNWGLSIQIVNYSNWLIPISFHPGQLPPISSTQTNKVHDALYMHAHVSPFFLLHNPQVHCISLPFFRLAKTWSLFPFLVSQAEMYKCTTYVYTTLLQYTCTCTYRIGTIQGIKCQYLSSQG